jgi:hypothetical protein
MAHWYPELLDPLTKDARIADLPPLACVPMSKMLRHFGACHTNLFILDVEGLCPCCLCLCLCLCQCLCLFVCVLCVQIAVSHFLLQHHTTTTTNATTTSRRREVSAGVDRLRALFV